LPILQQLDTNRGQIKYTDDHSTAKSIYECCNHECFSSSWSRYYIPHLKNHRQTCGLLHS